MRHSMHSAKPQNKHPHLTSKKPFQLPKQGTSLLDELPSMPNPGLSPSTPALTTGT